MIVSIVMTLENIVISGCYAVHECGKINMDVKWETLWIISWGDHIANETLHGPLRFKQSFYQYCC